MKESLKIYYLSINKKKEELIEKRLGKKVYDVLGISKEIYENLSLHSKYFRLSDACKANGLSLRKKADEKRKINVENFRLFLKNATIEDIDKVRSIMDSTLHNFHEKKKIEDKIRTKKKQLEALQKIYKTL